MTKEDQILQREIFEKGVNIGSIDCNLIYYELT